MNRGIIAAAAAAIGLVALIAVLGSWYTVDQTERAVLLRNGAVVGTAQPGLGFKIPFIDSVEKISVRTSTYTWDKMNSYSYDQQPADLKISVTLRASPGSSGRRKIRQVVVACASRRPSASTKRPSAVATCPPT